MEKYEYFILKENMSVEEIRGEFLYYASKVWPKDDFSDIDLTVKIERRYPELMALVRKNGSISNKFDLVVNPRTFDLSKEDVVKLLKHETIHLKITDHNEQFMRTERENPRL